MTAASGICFIRIMSLFEKRLEKFGVVSGDEIDAVVDTPLHVFFFVDCPDVDFHAEVVALFDPLGVFLHGFEAIVDACAFHEFNLLGYKVALKIIDTGAGRNGFDEIDETVFREGDIVDLVFETVFLDHGKDALDGGTFRRVAVMGFELADDAGVEFRCLGEICVECGDMLAVLEGLGENEFGGRVLDVDTVDARIVVDDENAVGGHPDVKLRGVAANRVGLDKSAD